jgi:peroxiredoxin (alkyl hydroperoxide reductase subunit C)
MSMLNKPLPDFECKAYRAGDIVKIRLNDVLGRWAVLFFYPADFSFVCPTELFDLQEHLQDFKDMSVDIYAVSTDSELSHQAWAESTPLINELQFPLLSDRNQALSRALDVLTEETGAAQRATFVVNPEGVVKAAELSDGAVARRADELVRKVRAAQFVSLGAGRLCPASWTLADASAEDQAALKALPVTDPEAKAGMSAT